MSGDIPCATSDTQSVQTTSGPLGQSENVHSRAYVDPKQPGTELAWNDCSVAYHIWWLKWILMWKYLFITCKSFVPSQYA